MVKYQSVKFVVMTSLIDLNALITNDQSREKSREVKGYNTWW
jgi:hypothetical protein